MFRRIAVVALVAFVPAVLRAGAWGRNNLWDDGRAEVAVYESEQIIDGKPRSFKEHLLTQKEALQAQTFALADPKKEKTIEAFRLTQVQSLDGANFANNYLTTVHVKEDMDQLVKMTVSVQGWTGNSIKMFRATDGRNGKWTATSRVAGEPDQMGNLELKKDDIFEDELPLRLRAFSFENGFERKIRILDWQSSEHATMPAITESTVRVVGEEPVRCRAGSIPCWIVKIDKAGKIDSYWFEKKEPNLLVKMETSDGRKRLLYGRARWTFWDSRIPRPNILN